MNIDEMLNKREKLKEIDKLIEEFYFINVKDNVGKQTFGKSVNTLYQLTKIRTYYQNME